MITSNQMAIQYIFTDWSAVKAKSDPKYPQCRTVRQSFDLLPLKETESFIRNKLNLINQYINADETDIPECSDEDLWRSEPVYKYYRNPEKLTRSTKNFANKQDAYIHAATEGVGIVIEKQGEVTACKYCSGFSLCNQKDRLVAKGELTL